MERKCPWYPYARAHARRRASAGMVPTLALLLTLQGEAANAYHGVGGPSQWAVPWLWFVSE